MRPAVLTILTLLATWPLSADISCPIDATCITCSGDITTALTNALNGEDRVILSAGACSFSSQQGWDGDTQLVGAGGLDGSTTLTYTGGTSPAFAGCGSDSASGWIYGIKLVLQNSVGGFCIEGFSNTSTGRDVWIDGGTYGFRFEKSGADNSSIWVGLLADVKFTNQSSHAVIGAESGNMNLVVVRPTASGGGDHIFSFESPAELSSNIQIIGGDLSPPSGFSAVEVQNGENVPVGVYDTEWTPASATDDFFLTTSSTLAVNQIDVTLNGTCNAGNLVLDKPGTGDDVACQSGEKKTILARSSDGKADVSNLSAADEATYQKWWDKVYRVFDRGIQDLTADYANSTNCTCSGDITSCIQNAWNGTDKIVYLGTGGDSGTGCTATSLTATDGAKLIGRGMGRTSGGAGEGTWLNFTTSSGCGLTVDDKTNVEVSGIKLGATNSAVDIVCWKDFDETSVMARIDTRVSNSHIVLQPNGSNVAASGGAIYSWLQIDHGAPIVHAQGSNSPFDLTIVSPDVGRDNQTHYDIDDVDPTQSAFMIVGTINQTGSGPPEMMNVSSSGTLPIFHAGTQSFGHGSGFDIFRADSDIQLTALGVVSRTDPQQDRLCDLFLDEPGTGEDLSCTHFVRSKVDELTDPLGLSDTAGGDTTDPTPGNSGAITTDQVSSDGFRTNWTKGTDDQSAPGALQYRVYRSNTNNMGTVADAKANGTLVLDWTTDIATHTLSGLDPSTTYWVNVLVRDEALNEAAYTQTSEATAATTGSSAVILGATISGEVQF